MSLILIKLFIGLIILRGDCFFIGKGGVELLIIDFEGWVLRVFDGDIVEDCFFWEEDLGMGELKWGNCVWLRGG